MATTKIWKIKNRFDNVIDYVSNKDKTDNKKYVSGINCLPETAFKEMSIVKKQYNKTGGILGFHAYQSFKGCEVTNDEAHEIGIRLAEELWGDRFQVIVTTHTNTKNVHNHFFINSVSFLDGKKYYDNKVNYAIMRRTSDDLCKEYELQTLEEKSFYKNISNRYARSSKYLDEIRADIDYAISQASIYNDFTKILTKMGYELNHEHNKMSIRKPPYKRYTRVERTLGEEYSRESILFKIKHSVAFKVPFPEYHTLTRKFKRTSKTSIRNKPKAKGLQALYYYYCYLLKVFPKQKYPPKYSKPMKEAIKKMDDYSNSARFLARCNITTLAEIKEYKSSAINNINELKGLRENLWRKHKRIKTFEEGQLICSEIQKLATKIDELNKDIKLCDFIENNTLKMKDDIKEMSKEKNNKVKVKNRDRYYR
ncbi:MAG: relaxase/mobilization nuclease domain-containing protein [Clostridia bacterium]|nr:relaxase/mobilization nuclease domain-containing protein [Clostridia bacterium]